MNNKSAAIGGAFFFILAIIAVYFWATSGYGKVSDDAYEMAKALYSTCMVESDERLDAVSLMLSEDAENKLELSDREKQWLESMIEDARGGNWKTAAKSARRMMEDQVDQ